MTRLMRTRGMSSTSVAGEVLHKEQKWSVDRLRTENQFGDRDIPAEFKQQ